MNYVILIIVAVAGVAVGMYLSRLSSRQVARQDPPPPEASARQSKGALIDKQLEAKAEGKRKILDFLQEHEKIQNNDVEKLAGVSNATAERYLNELEKEGKLAQHGSIGPDVFYTLK